MTARKTTTPVADKYAVTTWGQQELLDLECPSGQLAQVRAPGIQMMIAAGVLESADTLTSLVDEKHIKRVGGAKRPPNKVTGSKAAPNIEVDGASLMKDPENLQKVFTMVDHVVAHMVVQPLVKEPWKTVDGQRVALTPNEREEGVTYTDTIDMMDKMYIFQYAVGGDTDLESFRKQFL